MLVYSHSIFFSFLVSFFIQDPREALIISLKREVSALQEENEHLRTALHLSAEYVADSSRGEHILICDIMLVWLYISKIYIFGLFWR